MEGGGGRRHTHTVRTLRVRHPARPNRMMHDARGSQHTAASHCRAAFAAQTQAGTKAVMGLMSAAASVPVGHRMHARIDCLYAYLPAWLAACTPSCPRVPEGTSMGRVRPPAIMQARTSSTRFVTSPGRRAGTCRRAWDAPARPPTHCWGRRSWKGWGRRQAVPRSCPARAGVRACGRACARMGGHGHMPVATTMATACVEAGGYWCGGGEASQPYHTGRAWLGSSRGCRQSSSCDKRAWRSHACRVARQRKAAVQTATEPQGGPPPQRHATTCATPGAAAAGGPSPPCSLLRRPTEH